MLALASLLRQNWEASREAAKGAAAPFSREAVALLACTAPGAGRLASCGAAPGLGTKVMDVCKQTSAAASPG